MPGIPNAACGESFIFIRTDRCRKYPIPRQKQELAYIYPKRKGMRNKTLFSTINMLAVIGWVLLVIVNFSDPDKMHEQRYLLGSILAIILILSVFYVGFVWTGRSAFREGGFGTLGKVMTLFRSERATLAAWAHFLAMDLLAATLMVFVAFADSINHWLLVPCFLATFLFGPSGLLLFGITVLATGHLGLP